MDTNSTQFIEDPLGDIDQETLRNYELKPVYVALHYTVLVTGILEFILCLCAIVADILLIYVITKFKRLKTTVNFYIRHYAIFNIVYFVSTPIQHLIVFSSTQYCLGAQVEYLSLFYVYLFAFALGIDWLIMVFKPEFEPKIKRCYKYLTVSIYILGCLKFFVQSGLCFTEVFIRGGTIVLLTTYVSVLLFILVLDFLNCRYNSSIRRTKMAYSLTISNIIVLSWLPMFIYHLWYEIQEYAEISGLIFWYTEFIPEWISCSTSIVILVVLVKVNKTYRMAFAKVFKRSVREYSTEGESLDESEEQDRRDVFYDNATTCIKI